MPLLEARHRGDLDGCAAREPARERGGEALVTGQRELAPVVLGGQLGDLPSRADEELLQLAAHPGLEEVALLRDPGPRGGTGLSPWVRVCRTHEIGLLELGERLRPDVRQRAGSPLEHADSLGGDECDPCRMGLVERDAQRADVCAPAERGARRDGAARLDDHDLAKAERGEEREIPRPAGQDRAAHVLLDRSECRLRGPGARRPRGVDQPADAAQLDLEPSDGGVTGDRGVPRGEIDGE